MENPSGFDATREARGERPMPAFVVDTAGLPNAENFNEVMLLGLPKNIQAPVRGLGVMTINELERSKDEELRIPGRVGTEGLAQIRRNLDEFRDEVVQMQQAQDLQAGVEKADPAQFAEPLIINAKAWFRRKHLTWEGYPQTPNVHEIEDLLEQAGQPSLGELLLTHYTAGGAGPQIADAISAAVGGRARMSLEQIRFALTDYGIPRRTRIEEAKRKSEQEHERRVQGTERQVPDLSQIQPVHQRKVDPEATLAQRNLMKRAKDAEAWDNLTMSEQNVLEAYFREQDPLTLDEIADQSGLSRVRIRQLRNKGIRKLEQLFPGA